ncbi:MAG: ABC transporter permease [Bryobacteraceae bacterium]
MRWYSKLKNKLSHLRGRSAFDDALAEEIQGHLEMRADELATGGMDLRDALAQARREFGSPLSLAEDSRSEWRWTWLEDLARDLRYAARSLARDKGFALTAILSLALGIGVNTIIFSLASEFLFKEPSARNPAKLVRIQVGGRSQLGMREYRFLRDAGVFAALVGFDENAEVNWRSGETNERLFGIRVTDNFFAEIGMPIAIGRGIQPGETDVAVVSHRFWERSLNADPDAIGRLLVLDGRPHTLIGILPANHRTLVGLGFAPDLYVAVRTETARVGLYGRLAEGTTRQGIAEKLRSACMQLDQVYPNEDSKWSRNITVNDLTGLNRLAGNRGLTAVAAFFAMLMAAVSLLLMIACVNVASLLLARSAGRAREFAVRLSIGASRGRLIRQLLTESLLLSVVGAAAGLALNLVITNFLNGTTLPLPVPIRLAIQPDWRLLAYGAVIAVVSAVMAGLLPALSSTRSGTNATLKRDEHQVGGRALMRKSLVAGQLAVSVIVLVTAALFVRNLVRSATMNPGFNLDHTIWAQMRLVPESYPTGEKTFALVRSALEQLRTQPGVESATFTNVVPLNDTSNDRGAVSTDVKTEPLHLRYFTFGVAEDYFKTMAIPILAGREFERSDRAGGARVVIVNETLARLMFGNTSPVGRIIRFGTNPRTVVGVAANHKYSTLGEDDAPAIYEPYLQRGGNRANLHFLIRSTVPPATLTRSLSKALLNVEPNAAVEVKPMSQAMGFALLPSRAGAGLLGVIGALGLTLASIGLYGVLSYSVSRRIREIGLRIALGAQRGDVLRLVLGEGAWILGVGLATGISVSIFFTKPLTMFLVAGLKPSDPFTYVSVAAVLLVVGCIATLKPALRALAADPAVALRYE